jgi:hypothetical protein
VFGPPVDFESEDSEYEDLINLSVPKKLSYNAHHDNPKIAQSKSSETLKKVEATPESMSTLKAAQAVKAALAAKAEDAEKAQLTDSIATTGKVRTTDTSHFLCLRR